MIKGIDHIGIAIRNVEEGRKFYQFALGFDASIPTIGRTIKMSMIKAGDVKIELMEPVRNGVIARFLEKSGEGFHHICFEVDDIEAEIKSLMAKGIDMVGKNPQEGAEGKIAFLRPKATHGVLIELLQKKK